MIRTLKDKKCKGCGNSFKPISSLSRVCSFSCALKVTRENAWKKDKKDLEEKLKTLSDYEKDARKIFQTWIRQRDSHLPCISCGKFSNRYDAGHYFDAGVYSGLIFHEDNVHRQCSYNCNKMLHGNKANYRIGLVKKIGEDRVLWLEDNKDKLKNHKYTREELIAIKEKYKALLIK